MDRRLLQYYERELHHVRTMGAEFAREFPKIAGRLGIEDLACADPYVERMLEGFAFLAARVQLKIDAEFPRFTQGLLESVFPHYLAPTPSMAVVQFTPEWNDGALMEGITVPKTTVLRSPYGMGVNDRTQCEYRTSQPLKLWPVQVKSAEYYGREMGLLELPAAAEGGKSAIVLTLELPSGASASGAAIDEFTFYLRGDGSHPMRLYEQLLAHCSRVIVRPGGSMQARARTEQVTILEGSGEGGSIRSVGFDRAQQLLPYDARSFQGYRLLAEYFSFPQRFLFVSLGGLQQAIGRVKSSVFEIVFVLDDDDTSLESRVDASNFGLYCVPAINLFPKSADRIFVSERTSEFHVIPDRTRPLDFEVYSVTEVTGYGERTGDEKVFRPLFAVSDEDSVGAAYYVASRVPRVLSERERQQGRRSSYAGSELYLSIVDAQATPYSVDLRQLGVETMCTNRDLPLQMPLGKGRTDFALEIGLPCSSVRVVSGPTRPRGSVAEGETAWRLISHQSLNYLSLADTSEREGAGALRDLVKLYADAADPVIRKQVEAIRGVRSSPITRRIPTEGPITFGRGLQIEVTLEERGFEGTGVFAFGAVLEQFFARHVGLNSFTETVIKTVERGEIMRWPARIGQRPLV